MHLETKLPNPRCVRFKLKQIPTAIQEQCQLDEHVDQRGFVHARMDMAWCGLKESGRLAGDDMRAHLAAHGHHKSKFTPGFFTHATRPILFALVVDDFGVKCKNSEDFQHLRDCPSLRCNMKADMGAEQCAGIDLVWDCKERSLCCSVDECVTTMLEEFKHVLPKQHHHGPLKAIAPKFGTKVQHVEDDNSRPLQPTETKETQKTVGKFWFLARAVDNTILHALNELACDTAKGAKKTSEAAIHLLDCIACNPKPRIGHQASDVTLQVDSDAAFHVRPEAGSQAGGHHCLGTRDGDVFNAPIPVLAKAIKNVVGSAAEAEVAAPHMNAQEATPMRQALEEMGHQQSPTRVLTDNATAKGFVNNTVKIKRSKTFDGQFWWLKDREAQQQFEVIWEAGTHNLADCATKHHPPSHHKRVRPVCLFEGKHTPIHLQGCDEILRAKNR